MPVPIRVPLLLLAALAHHKGVQPPNPPPTKSDRVTKSSLFEVNPRIAGFTMQAFALSLLVLEVISIILLPLKKSNALIGMVVITICPAEPTSNELTTLPAMFIAGVTLLSIGVLIRIWCYKALGTLFTYEITIRPDHKLVTWGPYAYVRHPSYTGSLFLLSGTVVTTLGASSYANTCGIMTNFTIRWVLRLWGVWTFYVIYALFSRGPVEDAELKKAFGKEWSDYARRVAYRCIPGIY